MLKRALLLLALTLIACAPAWLRADWDGTEGRRVQIALEMLQSGDWMVPTLGFEPTWAKPPLHYWLLAACAQLFGDGFVALRIPSVLGLFAAAMVAGELLRTSFGATVGWIAALGIICSPIVVFVWPTAEIDPLFANLTAISIWCLAAGVARSNTMLVLASGVVAGLAFLHKGPPYWLFSFGAYIVWARHRRLAMASWHFVPMLLVIAAWFVPLWLWRVDPAAMLAIANEESVGRIAFFEWHHVRQTPEFWLRAICIQLPFLFWCFWEWRGARDARMGANDLTLRMCSGGAVLAVVLLTFFPGRPTRYLLPNVMLFTFAVSPAVAHFFSHRGSLPSFARSAVLACGLLGSAALLVLPFIERAGFAALGLALAAAALPFLVHTPRQVVIACLLIPLIAAWTVGLGRSLDWANGGRARSAPGKLLLHELQQLDATTDLATYGHFDSPLLLATGLLPPGQETKRSIPTTRWILHEELSWQTSVMEHHVQRLRLCAFGRSYVLQERIADGR